MVDTDEMQEGRFYNVYTDSNATTLLISKEDQDKEMQAIKSDLELLGTIKEPVSFTNLRYLEIMGYEEGFSFKVWEVLNDGSEYEYSNLITHGIEVYKRKEGDNIKLILKCDREIKKGYIQFY